MTELERSPAKVKDVFVDFLKGACQYKYRGMISRMASLGSRSIVVDFNDIVPFDTDLAIGIQREPRYFLPILSQALMEVLSIENVYYADSLPKWSLNVRIANLPEKISLRQLNSEQQNKLIFVSAIVLRMSPMMAHVKEAVFFCSNGHRSVITQDIFQGLKMKKPYYCDNDCDSKVFDFAKDKSAFEDFLAITVQELPEDLPAGEMPKSFEILLVGEIAKTNLRLGDRINLSCIPHETPRKADAAASKMETLYLSQLIANNIEVFGRKSEDADISREEEEHFRNFASGINPFGRLCDSFCPKIKGREKEKEAILLTIVGSPSRTLDDGSRLRGDISILLVGDAGTGKSEMLGFAHSICSRSVWTTGKGSTGVGLTAAVVKDAYGTFALQAGAAVLADQGILHIDEFDKADPEDTAALHQIMEQQKVSIAKAGIVATLNARVSIIGAMNPDGGKYDPYKNLLENIGSIPIPLLTRFDLVFVLRDAVDEAQDEAIGQHIGGLRKKNPELGSPLTADFLKRYLLFAKNLDPELTDEAFALLLKYWKEQRRSASDGQMVVTPRWLEALCRLTLAKARLLLHEKASEQDALDAIGLTEKMLRSALIDTNTGKTDVGVLYNRPLSEKGLREQALETFKQLSGESRQPVEDKAFFEEMEKLGRFTREQIEKVFQDMWKSGVIFEKKLHWYLKA